ncbi:hypothetical protein GCM10010218_45990 [Streptomyces mashuensis]|uniref:Uncharacterized protein n=1 Tax=Streptomyces mashuensis TaxID=33904 RepID=A0A919B6G3_9ACTN|nr:hypothetical protein [Streptomyces mashuensis]GHF59306.1 hypothetical protein GCM10010218_45990 [Streptomyces mashuensis]
MNAVQPGTSPPGAGAGPGGFRPTHVVPGGGLATWDAPDAMRPSAPLDPLLPVRLEELKGDLGRVLCSNGWSAWVDARLLVALPRDPPGAGSPPVRAADTRRLLAHAEEALRRYRQAVEDVAAGRLDGETFRATTRGLRIGVVADGESVWAYDAERDHWCYTDGTSLTALAAGRPAAEPDPGPGPRSTPREATRLDDRGGPPSWPGDQQ